MTEPTPPGHGLARRLTLVDAVLIGMGAMLGAGIFAAPGPAAATAGTFLLVGLALAGSVAYANATSSAQLAALYPESGGTYVYARERLGDYWGFLAGWAFIVGKTASLAAMALTFGSYIDPELGRPLGVAAVVLLTAVNYRGVEKTARLTRVLVGVVIFILALVVMAAVTGGTDSGDMLEGGSPDGLLGVLRSGGLLFFAFAGYARLATLGEEVVEPEVTIPRSIPLALGLVVSIYAVVLATILWAIGPQTLADADAPLTAVVEAGRWSGLAPVVRLGAAGAAAGVLLSLLAGVSRTALAMARRKELPGILDRVHPRYKTPHHAEVAAGALVIAVLTVADLRGAIGFSSFAVLGYYALTNAACWTLPAEDRRWPRWIAAAGLVGCIVLGFALPLEAVAGGLALLTLGSLVWWFQRRTAAGSRLA